MRLVCAFLTFFSLLWTPLTNASELSFLKQQLEHINPKQTWIRSYTGKPQYYLYDQALAAIAFTHANEHSTAQTLLSTLAKNQNQDGSWYFVYPNHELTDTVSGSIAWALLAFNTYQKITGSTEFEGTIEKTFQYLTKFTFEAASAQPGAIKFSKLKPHILSIEHQIDTIAAIDSLPSSIYSKHKQAAQLARQNVLTSLQKHWVGYRFISGSDVQANLKNKNEIYLDTQAWAYLALKPKDIPERELREGLKFNCGSFIRNTEYLGKNLIGFFESNRRDQHENSQFIWAEGTLGMIAALQKASQHQNEAMFCNGRTAKDLLDSLSLLQMKHGGVQYANHEIPNWFSDQPGVASTAWMFFAKQKINPFRIQ